MFALSTSRVEFSGYHTDSQQKIFKRTPVDVLQRLDLLHSDVLIDLVNRCIRRPELDDLRTDLCDEPAIGRTTRGGQFGIEAGLGLARRLYPSAVRARMPDCRHGAATRLRLMARVASLFQVPEGLFAGCGAGMLDHLIRYGELNSLQPGT